MSQSHHPQPYDIDILSLAHLVWRYKWSCMIWLILGMFMSVLFLMWVTPQYTAKGVLQLNPASVNVLNDDNSLMISQGSTSAFIQTEREVLKSRKNFEAIVTHFNLTQYPEFVDDTQQQKLMHNIAVRRLYDKVKIFVIPKSFSLKIETTTQDPILSQNITDMVMDLYFKTQTDYQNTIISDANAFFDERLQGLRFEINAAQKEIRDFQARTGFMTPKTSLDMQETRLSTLNDQMLTLDAQLSQKEAEFSTYQPQDTQSYTAFLHKKAALMEERVLLSTKYAPNHPKVRHIKQQMEDINTQINALTSQQKRNLFSEIKALKIQKKALSEKIESAEKSILTQRQLSEEFADLTMTLKTNQDIYQSFLNQAKTIAQQHNLFFTGARVVSYALPPLKPSFPNSKWVLFIGIMMSIFCAIAWIAVRENIGNRHEA